jgi:hypothetical protein
MRHEPSGSRPPVQPTADRRCRVCRAAKPADDFPVPDAPGGCCGSCQRRRVVVAHCRHQRTLRQVVRRAEAGYRTLFAQHTPQGGGGDAA